MYPSQFHCRECTNLLKCKSAKCETCQLPFIVSKNKDKQCSDCAAIPEPVSTLAVKAIATADHISEPKVTKKKICLICCRGEICTTKNDKYFEEKEFCLLYFSLELSY